MATTTESAVPAAGRRHASTAIVGAGFSGLAMAHRLRRDGVRDFLVFERAGDVGGTWRDNDYPGCACDVESQLYSFSFAPNPAWTRAFSPQPEIQAYLRATTERFGLRPHILFHHAVLGARWSESERRWTIETSAGVYTADNLVMAPGPLSEPKIPAVPGLAAFQGKAFHSAQWDHGHDLSGREVAVIGTGASAIQFIPQIQPRAKSLLVVQRTPPWIMPRMDHEVPAWQKRALTEVPGLLALWRLRLFVIREFFGLYFRTPRLIGRNTHFAVRHMKKAIKSPELRAILTPDYQLGCKRVLISDDYYPALAQPNVTVVPGALKEVRAHSIVLTDGSEHAVDTIIFGTGFRVTEMPFAGMIHGRGGRTLADEWQGSPRAFLGTTIAGFPNLYLLLGPNTGLGHSSVVLMVEAQVDHVAGALRYKRRRKLATLSPKASAQAAFVADMDRKSRTTVWMAGGCKSWYLDASGRNSTLWPASVVEFQRRVTRFRPADYEKTRG